MSSSNGSDLEDHKWMCHHSLECKQGHQDNKSECGTNYFGKPVRHLEPDFDSLSADYTCLAPWAHSALLPERTAQTIHVVASVAAPAKMLETLMHQQKRSIYRYYVYLHRSTHRWITLMAVSLAHRDIIYIIYIYVYIHTIYKHIGLSVETIYIST